MLVFSTRSPPMSTVISGAVSVSSCARSTSSSSAGRSVLAGEEVAEPVRLRLKHGHRLDVRHFLRGVGPPWRKRHLYRVAAATGRFFNAGAAAQDDQVG